MSEQDGPPPGAAPAPDTDQGSFWRGFLGAGIPIFACSLLSVAGATAPGNSPAGGLVLLWYIGAIVWVVAIGAMLNANRRGKPKTGTGILAALAFGLVALGTSCFANIDIIGSHLNGV